MHKIEIKNSKKLFFSSLLGIAMGTGWMTKIRLNQHLGISELIFGILILYLFFINKSQYCLGKKNKETAINVFFLFSVFLILPLNTYSTFCFKSFGDLVMPVYLISFILCMSILFLLNTPKTDKIIDFNKVTLVFCFIFLFSYLVSMGFSSDEGLRFSGFSKNPNQPFFYIISLAFFMSIYQKRLLIALLPFLLWMGHRTGSDAFIVSVVTVIVGYFVLRLIYPNGKFKLTRFLLFSFFVLIIGVFFGKIILSKILFWFEGADEGSARLSLLQNGLIAAKMAPFFGWGVGCFSGISFPFGGSEAHNNIVDLAIIFGIPFICIIYWLTFISFKKMIEFQLILPAAMVLGFLVSGLFHFSARHFVFWVTLAEIFTYLRKKKAAKPIPRLANTYFVKCVE